MKRPERLTRLLLVARAPSMFQLSASVANALASTTAIRSSMPPPASGTRIAATTPAAKIPRAAAHVAPVGAGSLHAAPCPDAQVRDDRIGAVAKHVGLRGGLEHADHPAVHAQERHEEG